MADAAAQRHARREEAAGWWLSLPTALLIIVLLILPTSAMLALSTTDFELGTEEWHFVGVQNFIDLLSDRTFRISVANTAFYTVLVTPVSVALGLGAALLIEAGDEAKGLFRSAYFLPVVSLIVAMATVWQYLMHPTIGPLNLMLNAIGLQSVNFLGSSGAVMYGLAIIGIWQATGFAMVLFLAGLTAIDPLLYQAAEIDGAKGGFDRFRLVTWPMLAPTTLFVSTVTMINAVKVFETVTTLTQGGPSKASEVILWTIFEEGFVYLHLGTASAMAVVFVAVLLVLVVLQTKFLDKRVHYG
jgi:multiple sugar transport system permease protein